jgi:hypothetical protein
MVPFLAVSGAETELVDIPVQMLGALVVIDAVLSAFHL